MKVSDFSGGPVQETVVINFAIVTKQPQHMHLFVANDHIFMSCTKSNDKDTDQMCLQKGQKCLM